MLIKEDKTNKYLKKAVIFILLIGGMILVYQAIMFQDVINLRDINLTRINFWSNSVEFFSSQSNSVGFMFAAVVLGMALVFFIKSIAGFRSVFDFDYDDEDDSDDDIGETDFYCEQCKKHITKKQKHNDGCCDECGDDPLCDNCLTMSNNINICKKCFNKMKGGEEDE